MKKKILSLLLVFMMCVSVLAGCSLWERNDKLYYEATVATITYKDGSVDKVSKRELITAFNSYGYNYVQNYGMSREEAIKKTLESVIEKYLTIKDVKDKLGENLFNDRETSYLWDSTFNAVYSNLKTYLEGYKEPSSSSGEEGTESNASVFKDYESKIESLEKDKDGNWVIRKKGTESKIKDTYPILQNENRVFNLEPKKDGSHKVFVDLLYDRIHEMTEQSSWNSAFNKYIEAIKENYSYKKFKKDKEWFEFEINRVYEIFRDNYIVEKYEDIYNTANEGLSNVNGTDILKAYSQRVRTDYANYVSHGNLSAYESSILTSVGDVDYIVERNDNEAAGNYFYVAPIKVSISGLDELKAQKDGQEISVEQYNIEVEKLFDKNKDTVSVRNAETGEVEGQKISVNSLYSMIQQDVSQKAYDENLYDEEGNLDQEVADFNESIAREKAAAYRKYFYLYNDDDTNKGKDRNAVFGVAANGDAITPEGYDNENVKAAIKELYNNGKAKVGDLSEVVRADDGYYIFFFAGNVENVFDVNGLTFDASTDKDNIFVLKNTRINIFSSKTLLDVIFDESDANNFSVFQTMDVNRLRSNTKSIVTHKENIKDLYK